MDFLVLLLCLYLSWGLFQALCFIANRGKPSRKRLPPGPWPLPIVGNLLQLGDRPDKLFAELAKTYGPIMTLQLGRITTVVISSAQEAREALQTHDLAFSSRTIPDAVTPYDHDRLSVGWLPVSPLWRSLRRIMSSHIFATRKLDTTQPLRRQKVDEVLALVRKRAHAGEPVEIGETGFRTSLNFLSNTFFSLDLANPGSDDGGKEFRDIVWNLMVEVGKPNLADYFPVLKLIDPNGRRRHLAVYFGQMLDIFDGLIKKRLQLRGKSADPTRTNDVLDSLLDINEDDNEGISMDHIKFLLLDLFAAGTDTTSTTLEWVMAELLHNPDKLSRAKAELEQIIGRGNPLKESDIPQLPYLQAEIKETFRLHPTVPLLVPHKAKVETEFCGFTIPKGVQVLVNVWAIGRDTSSWEDPDAFMPERFLGPNSGIDVKGQNFELIPFGAGRRICPGLPLAMRMLHLMLGSLVNCFDWKLENGMKPEDMNMEEAFGMTLRMAHPLRAVPVPL
ncbi:geraniol 8-hydroxylase-like [Punica granatum]|uniref:Geraniol 8-hydroxylase-like n=1 Tax=Punica granatum TaxID=22663 RepID=A0A6P8C804_PUNGR|nr:geraniol 8-hydroxylase-like [Punica granatum]